MDGPLDFRARRRLWAIYRCTKCHALYETEPTKCECGSEESDMLFLRAIECCELLGHKYAPAMVPGGERVADEIGDTVGGRRILTVVVDNEYSLHCSRCGRHGTRRMVPNQVDLLRSAANGR
jgi:hypothetical protein